MKLDCVLTSCNLNPLYCDFIPIFIKTWNKLYPDIDVKIVLISDYIPDNLMLHDKNIILFKPIINISTAFISQYIRLLYPAILDYEHGILITDIDILPMNKTYYSKNIESFENNKFIYYRDVLLKTDNQIAMCYNVATNKIWRDIFEIYSLENITNKIITRFNQIKQTFCEGPGNSDWFTDQIDLYNYIKLWNIKTNNFIYLNDNLTNFNRLDRIHMNKNVINQTEMKKIKSGFYSDYHCLRPYSEYKNINELILNLL